MDKEREREGREREREIRESKRHGTDREIGRHIETDTKESMGEP